MTAPRTDRRDDRQRGATMTEYAIVLFFIAILMIGAVGFFGGGLGGLFDGIADLLPF